MSNQKLRWGVMGCARIAKRALIPAIQQSTTGEVAAIASRQHDKAKSTAEELGIPLAYGSYEDLLSDPNIDAVYIPLPNHLHREFTLLAAEAGKHVLCEKPLALTAAEAQEMVDACQSAGVLLAEAFMYRHHPRYDRLKEILAAGEIGDIRGLHGTFTFNNASDKANVRNKKSWGGGSLYDVGCYPIHAARYLLDSEPEAASVYAYFSPDHDHVDMMASGLLEFHGNIGVTFDCGMWADFRNTLEIVGTDGRIEIPSAFISPADAAANFFVTVKGKRREEEVPHVNQYVIQVDDFGRSVLEDKPYRFPAIDAVKNMRVIDACLKAAEERIRVEL